MRKVTCSIGSNLYTPSRDLCFTSDCWRIHRLPPSKWQRFFARQEDLTVAFQGPKPPKTSSPEPVLTPQHGWIRIRLHFAESSFSLHLPPVTPPIQTPSRPHPDRRPQTSPRLVAWDPGRRSDRSPAPAAARPPSPALPAPRPSGAAPGGGPGNGRATAGGWRMVEVGTPQKKHGG